MTGLATELLRLYFDLECRKIPATVIFALDNQ